jgi:hypothetical protein
VDLPKNIVGLETFCIRKGLACVIRKGPDRRAFGNIVLQYEDSRIGVLINCDRDVWAVYAKPASGSAANWRNVSSLMELVLGEPHDILKIDEQLAFLEANWDVLVNLFAPENLKSTEAKLNVLGTARLKRLNPNLRME